MKLKLQFRILITTFLLGSLSVFSAEQSTTADSLAIPCKPVIKPLIFPKVIGFGSLEAGRQKNQAVYGDNIFLTIDSIPALLALTDSIARKNKDSMSDLILYINGNAMNDIIVSSIDLQEQKLMFHLDRHSQDLMKFYPRFQTMWSTLKVSISVGYKNGMILKTKPERMEISLNYISRTSILFTLLLFVFILGTFITLAATTNLIRIGNNTSPFSLALTQLSFWSIVIASSFIYIWIVTDEIPPLTGSTLILLSVSALTTAGAKLVDIRAKTEKSALTSHGFLADILEDELGYSVHRAQMFMWTVILGVVFITSVIRFQQIPQLDESLLGLMGISSGAYVGLKTMENKKEPDSPAKEAKNAEEAKTP
jgi:hypothetical protein